MLRQPEAVVEQVGKDRDHQTVEEEVGEQGDGYGCNNEEGIAAP